MSKKGPHKPPRIGSSLTDAVVAALAKVDDKPAGEEAPSAASGCAATEVPDESAPPPMVRAPGEMSGPNGFRSGPGSFSDLMRRWAGVAPLGVEAKAEPPKAEPPEVEPPEAEPPRVEPPRVEPPEVAEIPRSAAVTEPPGAQAKEPPAVEAEELPPAVETEKAAAGVAEATTGATPGGPVEVCYYGRTDVGLVREHNEDNFLVAEISGATRNPETPRGATIDERGCVYAVCDGMGGAAAGEVASQMAVDTILEVMSATPTPKDRDDFARRLVTSIEEAGQRIFSAAKMDRTRRGMGTTATLAGLVDGMLFVGQVGDSRAYVLRAGHLAQVTKDQSLVNQLIEAGQLTEEEAEAFEHSNIILQALGTTEEVTVDLTFLEIRRGDRLMMCSDGLSGLVHGDMIKEVLETEKDLTAAASKLIQMANAGGGHDNITVIVADFDGDGLAAPTDGPASYQQYPLPPAGEKVRGKSMPPRDTSMKAGALKPGADVKGADHGAGAAEDVNVGGDSNVGMIVVALIVLLVLVAGGWYLMTIGSGGPAQDELPPPPPGTPLAPDVPEGPIEEPLLDVVPSEPVEEVTGSVRIDTNVREGNLFVNDEDQGPISDGMTIELAPGAYTVEARDGSASIASDSVTVTAGATATVQLDMPEAPPEEPIVEEPDTPRHGGGREPRGGGGRHPGGREGTGGGQTGPLPDNPF